MHCAQVQDVARSFLCPELWTAEQYATAIERAGLHICRREDCTDKLMPTREIRSEHVSKVRSIVPLLPRTAREFLYGIEIILRAYRSGALSYSVVVAQK